MKEPMSSTLPRPGGHSHWTPSPKGCAKLNSDVGFINEIGRASSGLVIRDMNGAVLLSVGRSLFHVESVLEVEALVCLKGIQLA
jgi:hypothetical protein